MQYLQPEYHQEFLGFLRSSGREGRSIITNDNWILTSTYCKRWRVPYWFLLVISLSWFFIRSASWLKKRRSRPKPGFLSRLRRLWICLRDSQPMPRVRNCTEIAHHSWIFTKRRYMKKATGWFVPTSRRAGTARHSVTRANQYPRRARCAALHSETHFCTRVLGIDFDVAIFSAVARHLVCLPPPLHNPLPPQRLILPSCKNDGDRWPVGEDHHACRRFPARRNSPHFFASPWSHPATSA